MLSLEVVHRLSPGITLQRRAEEAGTVATIWHCCMRPNAEGWGGQCVAMPRYRTFPWMWITWKNMNFGCTDVVCESRRWQFQAFQHKYKRPSEGEVQPLWFVGATCWMFGHKSCRDNIWKVVEYMELGSSPAERWWRRTHSEAIQSGSKMSWNMGLVWMFERWNGMPREKKTVCLKVFCGTVVNSWFNSLAQVFWI